MKNLKRLWIIVSKRDKLGNYPKWWQWFFPRYGNYGGPGWSGGLWNTKLSTLSQSPIDALDACFTLHDIVYQTNGNRLEADKKLISSLKFATATLFRGIWYRPLARFAFAVWLNLRLVFYAHK